MLGDNVHAHKGEPGYQNTTVKRDPIELNECFIGEQIHTYDADREDLSFMILPYCVLY